MESLQFLFLYVLRHPFLKGERLKSILVMGRIQVRPDRTSTARWNLKVGGGKSLV